MTEFTLTVPAEHAEHFRAAMVEEIAFDTRGVQSEHESLTKSLAGAGLPADARAADLRNLTDQLHRDMALLEQIGLKGSGPIEVRTSDVGALAHVCETMAEHVVAPRITHQLGFAPIDTAELQRLTRALSWAIDRVAELYPAAVEVESTGKVTA